MRQNGLAQRSHDDFSCLASYRTRRREDEIALVRHQSLYPRTTTPRAFAASPNFQDPLSGLDPIWCFVLTLTGCLSLCVITGQARSLSTLTPVLLLSPYFGVRRFFRCLRLCQIAYKLYTPSRSHRVLFSNTSFFHFLLARLTLDVGAVLIPGGGVSLRTSQRETELDACNTLPRICS